jgi:hypothetical protein
LVKGMYGECGSARKWRMSVSEDGDETGARAAGRGRCAAPSVTVKRTPALVEGRDGECEVATVRKWLAAVSEKDEDEADEEEEEVEEEDEGDGECGLARKQRVTVPEEDDDEADVRALGRGCWTAPLARGRDGECGWVKVLRK